MESIGNNKNIPVTKNSSMIEEELRAIVEEAGPSNPTFSWTKEATKLLLQQYHKNRQKFRDPKVKKKAVWAQIVKVFGDKGYKVTEYALDRKIRNMKNFYKQIKTNKKRTGQGRVTWEYYDTFEEIFQDDKSLNISETAQSVQSEDQTEKTVTVKNYTPAISLPPNVLLCACPAHTRERSATPVSESSSELDVSVLSSSISKRRRKVRSAQGLYALRKKQLDVEERRVTAIKELVKQIAESNKLQARNQEILKERNKLFALYLQSKLGQTPNEDDSLL